MSTGTDAQRREAFDRRRMELGRQMEIYQHQPRSGAPGARLFNASGMLWAVLDRRYGVFDERPLMSEVARDFGANNELARMILLGKREPSKAFLDAVGWERVTLYRPKEAK